MDFLTIKSETKRKFWLILIYPENYINRSSTVLEPFSTQLCVILPRWHSVWGGSFMVSVCVAQCQDQWETKNNDSKLLE